LKSKHKPKIEAEGRTPKQSVCIELLQRFPDAATKTLANMASRDNRSLFHTSEEARRVIRYLRGASGNSDRKKRPESPLLRAPQKPADPFDELPEALSHFEDGWGAVVIDGPCDVLDLSDIHIPYHHRNSLLVALQYGRDRSPDIVYINGDLADFFSISFWEKDPRQRKLAEEIKTVREFLRVLRAAFPKARIIVKKGNHEERWERYLSVKAPELLGVDDFQMEKVLRYEDHGIESIGDRRPVKFGKLNKIHGHEYRFNISNPVNPARGFFLKAKTHVMGSHLHQTSQHSEKNLEGHVVSSWSIGCLCDLNPDYSPLNNWNHGFGFSSFDKYGAFQVDNLKIIDGKVY
jgi:predicted phosphodiesterase